MVQKGVILAGGNGTRLAPATRITNKHLLPIYDRPMIFYPLEKLKEAGIRDILIISGTEHVGDFSRLLGSGKEYGVDFTFRVQDKSLGIANAVSLSENFANGQPIAVILGDNIFSDSFSNITQDFSLGAKVFLKETTEANRFGVASIQGERITKIVEKPFAPETNYAVTGMYLYDNTIFEKIRKLPISARGEFEISDINQMYIDEEKMFFQILPGEWTDAGTHESFFHACTLARKIALTK
jgi:glucose-1-phosphate thymidylyltransferase